MTRCIMIVMVMIVAMAMAAALVFTGCNGDGNNGNDASNCPSFSSGCGDYVGELSSRDKAIICAMIAGREGYATRLAHNYVGPDHDLDTVYCQIYKYRNEAPTPDDELWEYVCLDDDFIVFECDPGPDFEPIDVFDPYLPAVDMADWIRNGNFP